MLFNIPEGAQQSHCKGCKAIIYWIKTESGRPMPVDPDGTSHFASCPNASDFRKQYHPDEDPRRPDQAQQYSSLMARINRLNTWEQNFIRSIGGKFNNARELTKNEARVLFELGRKYL